MNTKTIHETRGLRLHQIIGLLSKIEPSTKVTLIIDGGSATDKAGYIICNLCTEQDIFSEDIFYKVTIIIIKS